MSRPRLAPPALLSIVLAIVVAACSSPGISTPAASDPASDPASEPSAAASVEDGEAPANTDLNACEIVTPADIEAALELGAGTVEQGVLRHTPTVLSPSHTDCGYTGDWGGLVVSLTPEDGANLYDATRSSYDDASDRELTGADGAFWSADSGRFLAWKGTVAVLLQFTHITTGADAEAALTSIAQAAMDKVE